MHAPPTSRPSPSQPSHRAPWLATAAGALAVAGAVALRTRAPWQAWVHEPLHSALEAGGAAVALGVAGLLELRRRVVADETPHVPWVEASLAVGGVLDAAHACTRVGPAFFWSRALPTLLGGLLAAGMWVSRGPARRLAPPLWAVVAGAVMLGVLLLAVPGIWPPAFGADRVYTLWARLVNVAGGLGFLAGAVYLVRHGAPAGPSRLAPGAGEAGVFAAVTVLFGVAGVLFAFANVWSPVWWLFHGLRFSAYLVTLVAGAEVYRRIEATQRGHLEREVALQMADLDLLRAELLAAEPPPSGAASAGASVPAVGRGEGA